MKQIIINKVTTRSGRSNTSYRPLTLSTNVGTVDCRYYHAGGATKALILLGESQAGWKSPSHGLYPLISNELRHRQISTLHVHFRHDRDLNKSVEEVRTAAAYLRSQGTEWLGLIGHGFGGAVAIQAAAQLSFVAAVITLGTQGFGTTAVRQFEADTTLLLLHGTEDTVSSPDCSALAYHWANQPKQLLLYEGSGHNLDEVADYVHGAIKNCLAEAL